MVKADKLIKEQKEREDKKKDTFDKILEKIEKKIIMSSSSNNYEAWYLVPEFIIGLPMYNLKECIEYLEKRRLFLENIDNQLYELMKLL